MNKHTREELKQMQSLPLEIKIRMTERRIREWYEHYQGQVYVSFSGGKDSTVLADITHNRCGLTDVPLVFVDTGLEHPEIRDFVKEYGDKVVWLKPKKNFKQVITDYGYPFISKEVSGSVYYARKYLNERGLNNRGFISGYASIADFIGVDRRNGYNEEYEKLKKGEVPIRLQMPMGTFKNKEGKKSKFDKSKYAYFLEAPFEISNLCCNVMKKAPTKEYGKETGRKAITGQMADESNLRLQKWLQNGCNAFESTKPISNPMSFWTEQDVLRYIKENKIKIASVYGEVVEDTQAEFDGQMTFEQVKFPLKTTGCKRTGCMFCGFGCHLEKEGEHRFEKMKQTHPKQYDYIMRPTEQGGLNYKEVIDWINEHGNLNIKY